MGKDEKREADGWEGGHQVEDVSGDTEERGNLMKQNPTEIADETVAMGWE